MAWLQFGGLARFGAKFDGLWERFSLRPRGRKAQHAFRSLRLDPLEERTLLSLTPASIQNMLVNQPLRIVSEAGGQQVTQVMLGTPTASSGAPTPTGPGNQYELPIVPAASAGRATAADGSGDFVVAWMQEDPVYETNPNGTLVMANGEPVATGTTVSNIYARYFTDEVQQLVLPAATLANPSAGSYATFNLLAGGGPLGGGSELITISQSYLPSNAPAAVALGPVTTYANLPVVGSFTLTFKDPVSGVTETTSTIKFNENDFDSSSTALNPAKVLQSALNGLGGVLANCQVEEINSTEYEVDFNAASYPAGTIHDMANLPLLYLTPGSSNFTAAGDGGFMPTVQVSWVQQPMLMTGIPVSPTNPYDTSAAIENWFNYYTNETEPIAPTFVPQPSPTTTSYTDVSSLTTAMPQIQVVPAKLPDGTPNPLAFDITFVGNSADQLYPAMQVIGLTDASGNPVSLTANPASTTILKETSGEFRVNPVVQANPFSPAPVQYDSGQPAVAMDAAGDFVVAWTGVVPNAVTFGSFSDIFARRFTPSGYNETISTDGTVTGPVGYWQTDMTLDGQADTWIYGVRPLDAPTDPNLDVPNPTTDPYTFRVNNFTANAQFDPSAAMDPQGNMAFTWSNQGQDISFFNGIIARRFTVDGRPMGPEFNVNHEDTNVHDNSYVALSPNDMMAVAWNLNYVSVQARVFDTSEAYSAIPPTMVDQYTVVDTNPAGPPPMPTVSIDDSNEYIVGWQNELDTDQIADSPSVGIYAAEWAVQPQVVSGTITMTGAGYLTITGNGLTSSSFLVDPNDLGGTAARFQTAFSQIGLPCNFSITNPTTVSGVTTATYTRVYVPNLAGGLITYTPAKGYVITLAGAIVQAGGVSLIRPTFRANSAEIPAETIGAVTYPAVGNTTTDWPATQEGDQVSLDADGDLTVSFDGMTPDVSDNANVAAANFEQLMSEPQNVDLLPYFNPTDLVGVVPAGYSNAGAAFAPPGENVADLLVLHPVSATGQEEAGYEGYSHYSNPTYPAVGDSSGDVDGVIEADLMYAVELGATSEQVSRLHAILNTVVGELRSQSDGAMFTEFDAAPPNTPNGGQLNILDSDSLSSSMRDGRNEQYILILDRNATLGNFTLQLTNPLVPGVVDTVTVPVAYTTINRDVFSQSYDQIDPVQTEINIDNALSAETNLLGTDWPGTTPNEGPVDVRIIGPSEIFARAGTAWQITNPNTGVSVDPGTTYSFEITFQGTVHDVGIGLALAPGGNGMTIAPTSTVETITFAPSGSDTSLVNGGLGLYYALSMNGHKTSDLTFNMTSANDTADGNLMAQQIQAALANIATVDAQTNGSAPVTAGQTYSVVYNPTTYSFTVTFGSQFAGIGQAQILQAPPAYTYNPGNATPPPPNLTYTGLIAAAVGATGSFPAANPPGVPEYSAGFGGTPQFDESVGMTPTGSFSATWQQEELLSDQVPSGQQNLYYRDFGESTDTAGPRLANLINEDPGAAADATSLPADGSGQVATATGLEYLVVTFDKDMLDYPDPVTQLDELGYTDFLDANGNIIVGTAAGEIPPLVYQNVENNWSNSVSNPANYELFQGGTVGWLPANASNNPGGVGSGTNGALQQVLSGGSPITGGVVNVAYGMNMASQLADAANGLSPIPTNKFEAVLTLSANPTSAVPVPLSAGNFVLELKAPIPGSQTSAIQGGLEDSAGNPLNRTGFNWNGWSAYVPFTVTVGGSAARPAGPPSSGSSDNPINKLQATNQLDPAVATDANGDSVVVWTSTGNGIEAQLFNAAGIPLLPTEITVNQTGGGSVGRASVAMDARGDFVVAWAGAGGSTNTTTNTSDVFYRVFNPSGAALTIQMQANVYTTSVQNEPSVAMNPTNGNFVISWTSFAQPSTAGGALQQNANIFYRQFLLSGGTPAAGATYSLEQQVDVASPYRQCQSNVAMDDNGDFVIVWTAYTQNSNIANIDGRYYPAGAAGGSEFTLNTVPVLQDFTGTNGGFGTTAPLDLWATGPRVSMDITSGNYAVTWANYQPSTVDGYNVYYRQYEAGSTPMPGTPSVSGEQPVGTPTVGTAGWQLMPAVAMAPGGDFTVVWTSFGHDNAEVNNLTNTDYGIYAEMYTPAGAIIPYTDANGNVVSGPFRINATTVGDQVAPAVSSDDTLGNAVIAWVGPLTSTTVLPTAIYSAMVDPPAVKKPAPMATTTTLAASLNPAIAGQAVTFTATVKAASGNPGGSVTFKDGSTLLGSGTLTSAGTATFTTAALGVGSHSITASYAGTTGFAASPSSTLTETIKQIATSTTLTTSTASPVFGQAVTLTATVKVASPSTVTPTGTVTFKNGSTLLGTGAVGSGGVASFTTTSLPVGSDSLTASYAGTTNLAADVSAAMPETVKQAATTDTLTSSAASAVFDQTVTFTATVKASSPSGAVPTGTVTFKDGSTILGTGTLSAGAATFTTSALAVASHTITASYAATSSFLASGSAGLTETVKQAATTTTLTTSAASAVFGQTVTFTATVKAAAPSLAVPSGVVTFKDGSTVIGTATLTAAHTATLPISTLAVAATAQTITASYAASTNLTGSSGTVAETVKQATTSLTLVASPNPAVAGQTISFTATLQMGLPSTAVPTGLVVTFKDGSTVLGTAKLNAAGTGVLQTSSLVVGTHSITVSYAGSTNLKASISTALSEMVNSSTKTVVKSALVPAAVDQVLSVVGH
jgi:hypothetical protein